MLRTQMKEQIPANASALPVIRVPEGTTAKLAYVCDITGQLYISVDREALILCPSGGKGGAAGRRSKGGGGRRRGGSAGGRAGGGGWALEGAQGLQPPLRTHQGGRPSAARAVAGREPWFG